MEIIKFLQTTGRKNIKSYIDVKVREKLCEYESKLEERRQMLRDILESERIQYEQELIHMLNERLKEQFQKRLNWINTKNMERAKAEEELLKLKNQQREFENCEERRYMQSRELLLDTKKAQLYQIEEKKSRTQIEKHIEIMWLEIMEKLIQERNYQEIYENKLRQVIEGANQRKNHEIDQRNKNLQQLNMKQIKKEAQEENYRLLFMDEKYHQDQKRKEVLNRTRQDELLKNQIVENYTRKYFEAQKSFEEGILEKNLEDQQILMELIEFERQKVHNNEWHKYNLKNCLKDKQEKLKEENEFEKMYLNTGSVLQQNPKKPYCKNVR